MATFEERLKFQSGLPIGTSLVEFQRGDFLRRALVEISPRGKVSVLAKPRAEDMYTSWFHVKGDATISKGPVIVWAARNPEILSKFNGTPAARIPV